MPLKAAGQGDDPHSGGGLHWRAVSPDSAMNMHPLQNRNALAWFILMLALGVHVIDEALTGFLPFYNNLVLTLREQWGSFPMPVFSFPQWITGLVMVMTIGFTLTPVAAAGVRVFRIFSVVIGILMIGNSLGHLLGSVYAGYLLPGVTSVPLVLAAAIHVVWRGISSHQIT
jgi:hypothetical protein